MSGGGRFGRAEGGCRGLNCVYILYTCRSIFLG